MLVRTSLNALTVACYRRNRHRAAALRKLPFEQSHQRGYRLMSRSISILAFRKLASVVVCAGAYATPGFAGMDKDLADCTAADRKTSADACTRVMNSGRLPKNQFYIGHFNRASAYFFAANYEKALADFDKSIDYNPGYADTYHKRALVRHELGDREQSLVDLDRYLEKKGEVAEAYVNRARLFRRRGELNEAFSQLQRASALDPTERKIQVLRTLVLSDLGEQGPAHIEAEKAVSADPNSAEAYYARATVAFRELKLDPAAADLEKALSLKATFPAALTLRGRIEEQRGDKNAAVASFRKSLESAPNSLDARAAQDEARARLAVLDNTVPAKLGEHVEGVETAPSPPARPALQVSECRRFIPSASTTVAIECPK
jgi:tetratricopeptide (TPR) repeat protein